MPARVFLGCTKNDQRVYLDDHSTHANTHLEDTPGSLMYIKEALPRIVAEGDNVFCEVDLGRVVGRTDLVETDDDDIIIYAKRIGRSTYARFVKGKSQPETNYVTLVLHVINDGYRLFSAWIGRAAPPFPGDVKELPDSRDFWRKHALVWGHQKVQAHTQISEWPWD